MSNSPNDAVAEWKADPSGQYELRYWDGRGWTDHVASAGVTAIHRLVAPPPPPMPAAASGSATPVDDAPGSSPTRLDQLIPADFIVPHLVNFGTCSGETYISGVTDPAHLEMCRNRQWYAPLIDANRMVVLETGEQLMAHLGGAVKLGRVPAGGQNVQWQPARQFNIVITDRRIVLSRSLSADEARQVTPVGTAGAVGKFVVDVVGGRAVRELRKLRSSELYHVVNLPLECVAGVAHTPASKKRFGGTDDAEVAFNVEARQLPMLGMLDEATSWELVPSASETYVNFPGSLELSLTICDLVNSSRDLAAERVGISPDVLRKPSTAVRDLDRRPATFPASSPVGMHLISTPEGPTWKQGGPAR